MEMLDRLMTTVEASIEFLIVALMSARVNTRGCCALCSYCYIYAVFVWLTDKTDRVPACFFPSLPNL